MRAYLGVAVGITGRIFAHPGDGTPDADAAARARGDYPYVHLYEGDDIAEALAELRGLMAVEEEIARGAHDSSQGLRPTHAFIDRDGDISVSYPGGPEWMSWEQKVRHG